MAKLYNEFLCVGVGMSGVCLGVQLQRKFGFTDIHFYERNASYSGTWLVNRYPGVACDITAIFYSYSFAPNATWSRFLPPGDEIQRYLEGVVNKYNLRPHMTFFTEVESAEWDSERQVWTVHLRNIKTGKHFEHECRILYSAVGLLVEPKYPNIPGMETFKGDIFHTARWKDGVDLRDKNVVVIGNGCSASQMLPEITPQVKTVTQFIRTPHWLIERPNAPFGPWTQWALKYVPFFATLMRFRIFAHLETSEWPLFPTNEKAKKMRRAVEASSKRFVMRVAPKKYHDLLIPDWEIACKRRIFDADSAYLKTLNAPNLLLTKDPLVEILPTGVRTATKSYPADVIIMATGFHTNNGLGPLQIRGKEGEWLDDRWRKSGGPAAYNNTAVHGFPNFMIIVGPNSTTGYSSVVLAIENMVNYSLKIVEPILKGEATEVEVKASAENEYIRRLREASTDKVWNGPCSNWYVSAEGWNSVMYPYSQVYFWWRSTFPTYSDWSYKYTKRRSVIRRLLRRDVILAVGVVGVVTMVRGVGGWDAAAEYVREFVEEGRRLYLEV